MRSIAIRDELTDEWKKRGVKEQREYSILTAEISEATFGLTPSEYARFKQLKRENLRDRFIRLFGATDMHRATEAMNEAGSRLGRYLLMQLLINVSYGTLFGLALFAIGTNFLPPFCGSIVAVLTASSQLTPTLEQMSPESEFVRALNRAAAPTTRYSIIAGDLAQYQAPDPAYFDGLITKIGRSAGFDLLFGGSRNDIAVKLGSILIDDYPGARVAARSTVGCHHLNYFSSPAGQSALQAVEWG